MRKEKENKMGKIKFKKNNKNQKILTIRNKNKKMILQLRVSEIEFIAKNSGKILKLLKKQVA